MTIFILLALTVATLFVVTALVDAGHMKPNKFTKYAGINLILGKEEYNVEDYYG